MTFIFVFFFLIFCVFFWKQHRKKKLILKKDKKKHYLEILTKKSVKKMWRLLGWVINIKSIIFFYFTY